VRNKKHVDSTVFTDILKECGIWLLLPQKDLCDACLGHQNKNLEITEDIDQLHRQKKDEACAEMAADLANPENKFDLCPE